MPNLEKFEKEVQLNTRELRRITSPNYVSAYANNTHASSNFWDLRLFFGEIVVVPSAEPEAYVEDHACIVISWEHVKALRDLLNRMITKYELDNGTAIRNKPEASEITV